MTTIGCDPDMSTTGAPFGTAPQRPRVRSTIVLLVLVAGSVALATADPVPGGLAVPAAVVGAVCALVLGSRAVRVAHSAGTAAAAALGRALHRSRPVPTAVR
jgi:hypothetical protein